MSRLRSNGGMALADALLAFGLVTLFAGLSKVFTRDAAGLSTIWYGNGLLVAFLLTTPPRRWAGLLAAGFAGQVAGSVIATGFTWIVLPFAATGAIEAVAAAWPLARRITRVEDLTRQAGFVPFLLYGVLLAPVVSLGLGVLVMAGAGLQPTFQFAEQWLLSHTLGLAIMTPVALAMRGRERPLRRLADPPVLLAIGLALAVTALVFVQDGYPLLFFVFPPMLLVAVRTGFAGTAVTVLLVLTVALTATLVGSGPLMLVERATDRMLVLQLLAASLLLFAFPLLVGLAERRHALRTARDLQNRLQLLTDYSSDVVLLTDLRGFPLYVSPAVNGMLGWEVESFLALDWRELVHADDAEALAAELHRSVGRDDDATAAFRLRTAADAEIWVEAQVSWFRDADLRLFDRDLADGTALDRGQSGHEGLVLTLRDITRRKRAEQQLEQANRELASLVWKDGLTGLANRRRFDEALAEEWERCLRSGSPLSIVLIDVDHFKAFNDRYGHQQGDRSLLKVADAIAGSLFRPRDLAARYGGEEFALILPQTDTAGAALIAEKIRLAVADCGLPHVASPLGQVTVSTGAAGAVPLPRGSADDLVKIADEALYTSKHEGRNRSTVMDVHWPPA